MPILVITVEECPLPPTESNIVQCGLCEADCWESKRTADENRRLVMATEGCIHYLCMDCEVLVRHIETLRAAPFEN